MRRDYLMTKSRWRLLLAFVSLFAIMSIAVACGDDDDEGDEGDGTATATGTGTASATADAGDIAQGGEITIGATEFQDWDPHFANFAQDIAHFFKVWRGLYELDLDNKPVASMADGDPEVSSDGLTYTIKLKDGLLWSDGDDLLAEDFVAGIQRTCNPDIASEYQYILTAVVGCDDYYAAADAPDAEKTTLLAGVGVKAVDDTTIEIKIREAQPTFPIILALWVAFPVPVHLVPEVDAEWPDPVSNVYNGPFMVDAYTAGSSMVLVPNPEWSGEQKPYLDKITMQYVDDAAVLNNAYRADEIDATVANKPELDALRSEFGEDEELFLYPATRTIGLEYNLDRETFQDANVRLALSQATDRDTMMEVVFSGANTATTNWVPPARNGLEGGEYEDILGFDADSAKEHLAEAGFEDGAGFPEVTLLLTDSQTNQLAGQFLQSQWKEILGIDLKLEFVDGPTRSARFNAMDYDLVLGGWQEDYPDPENWFIGLWETDGSINKTGVSIPELDDLIADAKFNTNDEERREQYREAEEILLGEANGIAPIYHTLAAFLVKSNIRGMLEWKRPGDTFVPGDWNPEYWGLAK
jgi:oligopeptide transport system substrate-binding protein